MRETPATADTQASTGYRVRLAALTVLVGADTGFALAWLLGKANTLAMMFSMWLLLSAGVVGGLIAAFYAWRFAGRGKAGARAARLTCGLLSVAGAASVAYALATQPYAGETVAIMWLDGLFLRGIVPSAAVIAPALALVFGGALVGAVWAVRGWREQAEALRNADPSEHPPLVTRKQVMTAAAVAAASLAAYYFIPGVKGWISTAIDVLARGDIEYVRDYLRSFGVWAPVVSSVLMILQSLAAPLPAFVVTFSNGLLFGWAWGALLSWSSAMAGAALCFWIARSFGRPVVERLAGGSTGLEVSDLFFDRYGDRAVLIARLLPFVSFDIISYGAGLTRITFWRFFWATGLGQLPATIVYSYLGQNLTGSVRVLFLIFLFTAVVFVVGATIRPHFMSRLRARKAAASAAALAGE